MISDSELARMLFPKASDVVKEALGTTATTLYATAEANSSGGTVLVDFGNSTVSGDNSQIVEIPCSSVISEGDTVLVTLQGTTPVDAVSMGAGDRLQDEIDNISTTNYVWSNYQGLHVTPTEGQVVAGESNVLIASSSFGIYRGLDPSMVLTDEGSRSKVYFGSPAEADTTVQIYGGCVVKPQGGMDYDGTFRAEWSEDDTLFYWLTDYEFGGLYRVVGSYERGDASPRVRRIFDADGSLLYTVGDPTGTDGEYYVYDSTGALVEGWIYGESVYRYGPFTYDVDYSTKLYIYPDGARVVSDAAPYIIATDSDGLKLLNKEQTSVEAVAITASEDVRTASIKMVVSDDNTGFAINVVDDEDWASGDNYTELKTSRGQLVLDAGTKVRIGNDSGIIIRDNYITADGLLSLYRDVSGMVDGEPRCLDLTGDESSGTWTVDHVIDVLNGGASSTATGIPYGNVDAGSSSTVFTATVPGITSLTDGTIMMLHNGVVTSASGFTVNINGLGAKKCYSNLTNATQDSTIFNINYTFIFVYATSLDSGNGGWWIYRGCDANSLGYQLRTNSSNLPASDAGYRYRLWFTSADGTQWVPANTSASTNATTARTLNTRPIDPFGRIAYCSTNGTVAKDARPSNSAMWEQYTLTIGYSYMQSGFALTAWKPVYLKCTPQADGSAVMGSIVQALPNSEDGYIYIFLGIAYSTTAMELCAYHPVYWHDGTGLKEWTGNKRLTSQEIIAAINLV